MKKEQQCGAGMERGVIRAVINGQTVLASVDRPGLTIPVSATVTARFPVGTPVYYMIQPDGRGLVLCGIRETGEPMDILDISASIQEMTDADIDAIMAR